MYFDFSDNVKEHKFYILGKYIAKFLSFFAYKKLIVKGRENIPLKGSLIIASNHIAFSDPAIIVANCRRNVHFMAKSELFENPLKSVFMQNMNAFPVKRNHFDRASLRRAAEILDKGWVLGIFPEGRRVRNSMPTESKNGVAYIAKISGADILPVCIYRAPDDSSLWHDLVLVYGNVIRNDELSFGNGNKSRDLEKASELIMSRINDLWESENESNSC